MDVRISPPISGAIISPATEGRGAAHQLEEQRQKDIGADQRHGRQAGDGRRDEEDAVGEEIGRQHRFGGAALAEDQHGKQRDRPGAQAEDDRRGPRIDIPAPAQDQQQGAGRRGQQHGAGIVDAVANLRRALLQPDRDQDQRRRADRQIDIEDPAPGQRIGDEAAEQRPGHAGDGEDAGEQALVAAALARPRRDRRSWVCDRVNNPPRPAPATRGTGSAGSCSAAMPHKTEPIRNKMMATKNSGLRPFMSLSLP